MNAGRVLRACLLATIVLVAMLLFSFGGDVGPLSVVVLEGRSMEPSSYDNDRVICLRRFSLAPGRNYVVRKEGELLFKHLQEVSSRRCFFVSLNRENDYPEFWCSAEDVVSRAVLVIPWHWIATTREEEPAKMALPTDEEKMEDRAQRAKARVEQERELAKRGMVKPHLPSEVGDCDPDTGLDFPGQTWEITFPESVVRGAVVTLSATPRDMIPPSVEVYIDSGGEWKSLGVFGGGSHELLIDPPVRSGRVRLEHVGGDPPVLDELYVLSG